jgi:hypothetical protein
MWAGRDGDIERNGSTMEPSSINVHL